VIPSLTTQTRQVMAQPDGTFRSSQYLQPVRVKRGGAWVAVDTTLVRRPDAAIGPKASASTAVFSGGGSGPAVTLTHGTQSLAIFWPTALPAPLLHGSAATYANVLPGVDLQLNATSGAYTEVLVVRDAAAAANPALRSLKMTVTGRNLTVRANADASMSVLDPHGPGSAGTEVFRSSPPTMWDSTVAPRLGPAPGATGAGTGRVSRLALTVSSPGRAAARQEITLTPPAAALTGPRVAYPLYIDPWFAPGPSTQCGGGRDCQYWVELVNGGTNTYNSSSSGVDARAGNCIGLANCNGFSPVRSYFQMDTSGLLARNGVSASVSGAWFYTAKNWSSQDCTAEPTELDEAGTINGASTYPGPDGIRGLIDTQTTVGYLSCSGASGITTFTATVAAQDAVGHNWPNLTLRLRAPNESDSAQWARFDVNNPNTADNPHLDINFNFPPGIVSSLSVAGEFTCNGTTYVNSNVNLQVNGQAWDNNTSPLPLDYWFEVYQGPGGSGSRLSWNYGSAPAQYPSGAVGSWTSNFGTYGNGDYSFRATVDNVPQGAFPAPPQWAWTGASGDTTANYSASIARAAPWHNFTVLNETPATPTISSYDFPHDVNGNAQWGAPQGYGSFTLTNPSPDPSKPMAGYSYAFDSGGAVNSVPNSTCDYAARTASGGSVYGMIPDAGNTARLPIPASLGYGHHTLWVRSFDVAHNMSAVTAGYSFYLAPALNSSVAATYPVTGALVNPYLGKCVDDWHGGTASGTIVDSYACDTGPQQWAIDAKGEVTFSGMCLDATAPGGATYPAAGTLVMIWSCNGGPSQIWRPQRFANGDWGLYNPGSGRCLDDPNDTLVDGTQLQIYDCNGSPAQIWAPAADPNRYEAESLPASSSLNGGFGAQTDTGEHPSQGLKETFVGNAAGDYLTLSFTTPAEADYALGAAMVRSFNYGQVRFDVDGTVLNHTDASPFDGYAATCCSEQYVPLGGLHLTAGPHTLRLTFTGRNPASTGYMLGIDYLTATPISGVTASSFAASLNNHGISDDANTAAADLDNGNPPGDGAATGTGNSLSAQSLAAAHLSPGSAVTLDGINFRLPAASAAGNDNTIALGQTIALDPAQQIPANAVGLLVAATNAGTGLPQTTATLTYSAGLGTTAHAATEPTVPAVPDWIGGDSASAAYTLSHGNTPSGPGTYSPRLYLLVLPAKPSGTLASITLPYYGTSLVPGSHAPALHVLAIGVRPAASANLPASADTSGNGHPVAMHGNVGFTTVLGGAASFDSTGGYLSTSGPILDTTRSFSVAAWVNARALGGGSQQILGQEAQQASGYVLQYNGAGKWEFAEPTTDAANPATANAQSASPAVPGAWTHLVGTFDATTHKLTIYVNGAAGVTATNNAPIASTGPTLIGRGYWNGALASSSFNGEIAGVQVYQRALTPAEVSTLAGGAPATGLANPAGLWPLEDFGRNWTGAWAAIPDGPAGSATPALGGTTLRQIIHPTTLGTGSSASPVQARIRLSDKYGSAAVTITAASIAAQTTAKGAATGTPVSLTFGGPAVTGITIQPGSEAYSDPVTLPDTSTGSGDLAISLALAAGTGTPPVTAQQASSAYPVYLATGNQTADSGGAPATWTTSASLTGRYYLTGLDVTATVNPQLPPSSPQPGTVAILGDQQSAAAPSASAPGARLTFVDDLPGALNAAIPQDPSPGGFVNLSNPGNSVAAAITQFAAAPNSTVLDEPNLRTVLITLGANDLFGGAAPGTIENNLKTLISAITPYGITNYSNPDGSGPVHVYVATVPAFAACVGACDSNRNALNAYLSSNYSMLGAIGVDDIATAVAGAAGTDQNTINTAIANQIAGDATARNW